MNLSLKEAVEANIIIGNIMHTEKEKDQKKDVETPTANQLDTEKFFKLIDCNIELTKHSEEYNNKKRLLMKKLGVKTLIRINPNNGQKENYYDIEGHKESDKIREELNKLDNFKVDLENCKFLDTKDFEPLVRGFSINLISKIRPILFK